MTDLTCYLYMLSSAQIEHEIREEKIDPYWTIVIVDTTDEHVGYIGFCAQHAFDRTGKLVAVGGAE